MEKLKKNELKFTRDTSNLKIVQDKTDFGDLRQNLLSDNENSYIVDSMIIKGVSVRREENDANFDYNLQKDLENEGMRFYMHKYFTGHMHYYQHLKFEEYFNRAQKIEEIIKA